MSSHRVESSRLVAADAERAFDRLLAAPLPTIFVKRYAAFPPVTEVRGQPAVWGEVGQDRTIVLADGSTIHETLTSVERPHGFGYVLDDITGPLRPFVSTIDGVWSVTPEGDGARISWAWTLHPKAARARLTTSVLGRMWKGYAERALARVEDIVTA